MPLWLLVPLVPESETAAAPGDAVAAVGSAGGELRASRNSKKPISNIHLKIICGEIKKGSYLNDCCSTVYPPTSGREVAEPVDASGLNPYMRLEGAENLPWVVSGGGVG